MNSSIFAGNVLFYFLNGVCRHEHGCEALLCFSGFLNGVCRHELTCAIR
ncbi:hypothetical protein J635_0288 [Acinetobacter baumannii 233846]|nr:hypothetical protein J635_0288 [Acinetobacter baumannii 233846]